MKGSSRFHTSHAATNRWRNALKKGSSRFVPQQQQQVTLKFRSCRLYLLFAGSVLCALLYIYHLARLHNHQVIVPTSDSILSNSLTCAPSVARRYASTNSSRSEEDLQWCKKVSNQHHVKIGRSWGSLSRLQRLDWDKRKCNELLSLGQQRSCDARWGWRLMSDWLSDSQQIVSGVSSMICSRSLTTSVFCQYKHVVLDFSRVLTRGSNNHSIAVRTFSPGFITVFTAPKERPKLNKDYLPPWNSLRYESFDPLNRQQQQQMKKQQQLYELSEQSHWNSANIRGSVMSERPSARAVKLKKKVESFKKFKNDDQKIKLSARKVKTVKARFNYSASGAVASRPVRNDFDKKGNIESAPAAGRTTHSSFDSNEHIKSMASKARCNQERQQQQQPQQPFPEQERRYLLEDQSYSWWNYFTSSSPASQSRSQLQQLAAAECDEIETRPTFVVSTDDIFNLGHYFNDVMGVWGMLAMTKVDSRSALLLNIDALRLHRPVNVSLLDSDGPYSHYFESWFAQIKRPADYFNKRVCFQELYLPTMPGVPWFWNDWGIENDCSLQAPSPLYQSFNLFLRQRWQEKFASTAAGSDAAGLGAGSNSGTSSSIGSSSSSSSSRDGAAAVAIATVTLPAPPQDRVHIVIEARSINRKKRNNHSTARFILNVDALCAALEAIGTHVQVTVQNFALLPFQQQVALSHSASIFVSMHGAGTTHIFHSAIGQPNCCALIEMFPGPTATDLYLAYGYGNIARNLGLHHYRYVAAENSTSSNGTVVDVLQLRALALKAIDAVTKRPTCLHDIRDIRTRVAVP